jgi:flagellar assembly protein FliH
MDTHARYMFDAVFASSVNGPAAKAEIPRHTDQALEAARDGAYQQGLVDGRAQVISEASSHTDQMIARLLELVQVANQDLAQAHEKSAEQAARLALVAAQTLVPALIAKEPKGELLALFGECVAQLDGAPQLVIHAPANSAEELKARLDNDAANLATSNEIRIVVDKNMDDGDCRIAWATGEISRSRKQLELQIAEIVERRYPCEPETAPTEIEAAGTDAIDPNSTEMEEHLDHEGASR